MALEKSLCVKPRVTCLQEYLRFWDIVLSDLGQSGKYRCQLHQTLVHGDSMASRIMSSFPAVIANKLSFFTYSAGQVYRTACIGFSLS